MVFAGVIVGTIALASIIVISVLGVNKANEIQSNYDSKMKDLVEQINAAQFYEYQYDKNNKKRTDNLQQDVNNVRKEIQDRNMDTVTKTLNVADNLKANVKFTETNNIRFSSKWNGYPDTGIDKSEISNDTDVFKKLMIVGNKSGGAERRVGIWDQLDVHGGMRADGLIDGQNLNGRDSVNVGNDAAWMRKDGNIYGKGQIEGQGIKGRDQITVGNSQLGL